MARNFLVLNLPGNLSSFPLRTSTAHSQPLFNLRRRRDVDDLREIHDMRSVRLKCVVGNADQACMHSREKVFVV